MKSRNLLRRLACVTALGAQLLLSPASAAVLLERLPGTDPVGLQADTSTGTWTESFSLGRSTVEKISWWGYHGDNSAVLDQDVFDLFFNGNAVSGTLSYTAAAAALEIVLYELQLTQAVSFGGGATTLELGNGNFDTEWFWQGVADTSGNLALRIEGTAVAAPVSEPHALALAAIALLALGASRRRQAARA